MTWKAARLLCLALLLGALGVLVGASPATAAGVTRYVVSSGDDTDNDCTDPANPCQHLQYAIDQANDGDTIAVGGTVASNVTVRTSLTITQWSGQAPAVLDGGSNDTVVKVDGTGAVTPPSVTLSDLTIQNGAALGFLQSAGGVYNNATLDVENTTISGNLADNQGGGIYNDTGGTLTVANSTVSNNSATNGGGLANASGASLTLESSTVSDNSAFNAGGAFLDFGTATILRSTIAGNSAPHQGGGINVQPGAATLLVAESTLTGNVGGIGGAFWNQGTLTVESSTITANSSGIGTQASATFAGDIIAGQNGPDCEGPDPGPPLLVAIADAGYNVDDDGTCGLSAANHSISDSSAIDSYLGGLADNGGPTETQALLNTPSPATSATDPALGAVPPSFDLPEAVDGHTALCSVADQRGITPAAGLNCDIGAYLLQPTATSLSASSATIAQGGSVTYTATVFPAPDGGTVTFSDGAGNPATTHCAAQPLTGGTATCTVSYPAAGGFAVSATYSGDGASNNFAASTSAPKTETVLAPPVAPAAPDTQPPSAPVLTGQLTNNVLLLTWQASTDNVGVDHYEIYLGGSPIGSLTRLSTQLTRKAFDPHGDSAYTVRAFDAAGNQSAASNAVTIEPVPRPSNVPAKIPRWAWKLLAFQDHRTGTRPKTPKPLPHWYAAWKKWRHGLFRLVG